MSRSLFVVAAILAAGCGSSPSLNLDAGQYALPWPDAGCSGAITGDFEARFEGCAALALSVTSTKTSSLCVSQVQLDDVDAGVTNSLCLSTHPGAGTDIEPTNGFFAPPGVFLFDWNTSVADPAWTVTGPDGTAYLLQRTGLDGGLGIGNATGVITELGPAVSQAADASSFLVHGYLGAMLQEVQTDGGLGVRTVNLEVVY